MKLIIKPSNIKEKKYTAIFYDGDRKVKTTHFGSKGMSDFTKHKDPERKKRYLARHRKNENWNDMYSAGALSRWILWGETTLTKSIASFKKRFNLT